MPLSREQAVNAAQRAAAERGWRWQEPVRASPMRVSGRAVFEVRTNAENRGCNARIVIDAESGAVVEARWLPR